MSLVQAADFQRTSTTVAGASYVETVGDRIRAEGPGLMPPGSSPQLSPSERDALEAWLAEGAPAYEGACSDTDAGASGGNTGGGSTIDTTGLSCYRLLAHDDDASAPYKVGTANDSYLNFVFASPWQGTAYGIVLRPIIDNTQVIHHWLLYEDVKPGTPGGPVPTSGAHPDGRLLYGWAPGAGGIDFRDTGDDVGIELPATTYTMEFHYNSTDKGALDASGVELCVSSTKPAEVAAYSWLGSEHRGVAASRWTGACAPTASVPIKIVAVWPHMHLQGRHMTSTIQRVDGSREVLHDAPFDFDYQLLYPKSVTLQPGDTVTTECDYAKPMGYGTETTAEMCYLFTMAYPKGALADDGILGQVAHGEGSCLGQ